MNNYYVLIYLTEALKNNCEGKEFKFSTSPHKNVWEGYLSRNNQQLRLVFSAQSAETALFTDQYRAAKKSNITSFFDELSGLKVKEVCLAEHDRFISFYFENDFLLLFRLFGNQPNCFLVKDGLIQDSFKQPGQHIGSPPPEPRKPGLTTAKPGGSLSPKKAIIKTNPKFPRHLIPLLTDEYNLEEKSTGEVAKLTDKWTNAMTEQPEFRILENGNLCLLPKHILPAADQKVFTNCNDAVKFAYYNTSRERRLSDKLQSIKPRVDTALRKTESALRQLEDAEKGLERAETYEQYGHLLMSQAHRKPAGNDIIEIDNFYDENTPVSIPVKPGLPIAENARLYYDKSAKAIRNVEESKRRFKETEQKLAALREIANTISQIEKVYEFDEWYKENEDELQRLGILAQNVQKEKSPYKKMDIDGFEVWIGKNAKSNDRLTTDAHKEDVWMHARGVSGSHVAIRMNNRQEMPPKSVIIKAASAAAWNSKARGAGLVPVIVTKRKYVTKPKGAPAGTVRVQREQVEMVKPQKIS